MSGTSFSQIARMCDGQLIRGHGENCATGAGIDTRNDLTGRIFVALPGEKRDGHEFLLQAAQAGAAGALVAQDANLPPGLPEGFGCIAVPSPLSALQRWAFEHRRELPVRVLGVTGSNGKTSTKDMTAAVLSRRFQTHKTAGNFNNHIGLPLSLLDLNERHEWAVLELGMNHSGEIAALCHLCRPDAGIITNIGVAHIEFFGSREAIAKEKGALAEALPTDGFLVLNAGDEFSPSLALRTRGRVLTAGEGGEEVSLHDFEQSEQGATFHLHGQGESLQVRSAFPGRHMAVNAALAAAAGLGAGLSLEEVVVGLESIEPVRGRLQPCQVDGWRILDDSYNANPDSMCAALETAVALQSGKGRTVAVLGGMGELGDRLQEGLERVGRRAGELGVDLFIGVGTICAPMVEAARKAGCGEAVEVESPAAAARYLEKNAGPEDLILLKASRAARIERVIEELTTKESATS